MRYGATEDSRNSINGIDQGIPDELKGKNANLDDGLTKEEIREELLKLDLTVQLEQFIDTFLENVTQVAFKAIKNGELDPQTAYHQFRQLLVYVRGFRLSMYDPECSSEIIRFFDTQMPKAVQPQDQNIMKNYIKFFQEFFQDFFGVTHYKYQSRVVKHLKEAKNYLEDDYGYEPHLEV